MDRARLGVTALIVGLFVIGSGYILATSKPTDKVDDVSGGEIYRMSEVERHDTEESCWAVVNDSVYDLTEWIGGHPGGEKAILSLCGTDATVVFEGQHGGDAMPEAALANFKIGTLKK